MQHAERHAELIQGDQSRAAIVRALRERPGASVREVARMIGQPNSYGNVLQHIKALVAAGRLVEVRPTGTRRWEAAGDPAAVIRAALVWRDAITRSDGLHAAEQGLLAALANYDEDEVGCA